jgi:hypothetical protein
MGERGTRVPLLVAGSGLHRIELNPIRIKPAKVESGTDTDTGVRCYLGCSMFTAAVSVN